MWRREQYERAALNIAKDYVDNNGESSLNDLATKVAQDGGLNPEGVRTLVRLANVSAFQELFPKKAGEDKNIEFDLGDPEAVLSKLHSGARDKLASVEHEGATRTFFQDYYGPMTEEEKIAEAPAPEPEPVRVSPKVASHTLQRVRQSLEEQREEHTQHWLAEMEKGAQVYRAEFGLQSFAEKTAFEKDVISLAGESVGPELQLLSFLVAGKTARVCAGEDLTKVAEHHIGLPSQRLDKVIKFVKTAFEARTKASECSRSVTHVDALLSSVSSA